MLGETAQVVFDEVERVMVASAAARAEIEDSLRLAAEAISSVEDSLAEVQVSVEAVSTACASPGSGVDPLPALQGLPPALNHIGQTIAAIDFSQVLVPHAAALASTREQIAASGAETAAEIEQARNEVENCIGAAGTAAEAAVGVMKEVRGAVIAWTGERRALVEGAVAAIDAKLEEWTSAFREQASEVQDLVDEALLTRAANAIEARGGQLTEVVDALRESGIAGIGEIRDRLRTITDQLRAILDLIEPVRPVLETAASIA